jgi:hypothetical protein
MAVSRQRISKHVPVTTNTYETIELLLEMVFSTRSVRRGYKEENWYDPVRNWFNLGPGSITGLPCSWGI